MKPIIRTIDEISLDWLNAIMPNSRIRAFKIESASEEFCSSIARICLSSGEADCPSSIFLKFAKYGKDGKPTGSGRKEVKFYNAYLASVGHASIPRCYYAVFSEETGHYNIVLEDLTDTHDQREWPDAKIPDQYCLVAECLAGVHAKWWNRLEAVEMLGLKNSGVERQRFEQSTKLAAIQFVKNYSNLIPAPFLKTFTDSQSVYDQVFTNTNGNNNVTVIHGDTHFWNFLYPKKYAGKVYLIDWESYDFDMPTHDLVKFAAVIWSTEKRKRYENQFLRTYHNKLFQHGVGSYPFDTLLLDYKLSILKMLYLPVQKEGWGLPKEIWLAEFNNIMSAIDDLNCIGAVKGLI